MDFTRNLVNELDKAQSEEVEQDQLIRGQERMRRLGVWDVSAKELNEELMKAIEEKFGIDSGQYRRLAKFHGASK